MEQEQQQCIFCQIANGQIPAKKVYEDEKVVAVLDINPATRGHTLVLPKDHIAIMPQMDEELSGHVGRVAKQVSQVLIKALKVEGTSIFVANGAVAGQRAPHFMLHVIPREQGDGVQLSIQGKKMDENVMKQVFNKLAGPLSKNLGIEMPTLEGEQAKQPESQPPAAQKPAQPSQPPQPQKPAPKQRAPQQPEQDEQSKKLDQVSNVLAQPAKPAPPAPPTPAKQPAPSEETEEDKKRKKLDDIARLLGK